MKINELLKKKQILLSDGAWGTEIAKYGFDPGICPELFNIDKPDAIREVASSYVNAGSDLILTNTFGGNSVKLSHYGLEERLSELNEAGIRLSREASGGKALIVASAGSTGEFLEPLGTFTESDMVSVYASQIKAFVKGGADAVLFETMTALDELKCAVKAAKENSDLEIICSMTFDKGPRGYATMMGITPDRAVSELEDVGADFVGSNCGAGIENMIEVAAVMKKSTGLPLWIKPNAGLPELIAGKTVFRETPEQMALRIPELVKAGASIIGGCCGTTPGHILKFREVINRLNK